MRSKPAESVDSFFWLVGLFVCFFAIILLLRKEERDALRKGTLTQPKDAVIPDGVRGFSTGINPS